MWHTDPRKIAWLAVPALEMLLMTSLENGKGFGTALFLAL